jgi:hypothetical protein
MKNGEQNCFFCNRKDSDMPVYSCGLGRLGICLECVEKARIALIKHQEEQGRKNGGKA